MRTLERAWLQRFAVVSSALALLVLPAGCEGLFNDVQNDIARQVIEDASTPGVARETQGSPPPPGKSTIGAGVA